MNLLGLKSQTQIIIYKKRKQNTNIIEMLDTLKISKNLIKNIENSKQEYVW